MDLAYKEERLVDCHSEEENYRQAVNIDTPEYLSKINQVITCTI